MPRRRSLLRGSDAPPFAPVPYFWSDQYETKIQFVGQPGPDVEVVEGSLDDDRFVAAYGRDGRLVGALSFNRPRQIMAFRAMIANGRRVSSAAEGERGPRRRQLTAFDATAPG